MGWGKTRIQKLKTVNSKDPIGDITADACTNTINRNIEDHAFTETIKESKENVLFLVSDLISSMFTIATLRVSNVNRQTTLRNARGKCND